VRSKFTFSGGGEEEETFQSEPDGGRTRTRSVIPKRANTDFELGWTEQTQMVQNPAFSRVPGINKDSHITQDSSPWNVFEIFFSPEMFKLIQNRYTTQQINK
jgi:hypothetical protein